MSEKKFALLREIAGRSPLESFEIESGPAYFETHQGRRTLGTAAVVVSRSTLAIRFEAEGVLLVPEVGYGESNGKVYAADGAWSASDVNDAGVVPNGSQLFGTTSLVVGRDATDDIAVTRLVIAGACWEAEGVVNGRHAIMTPLSRDVVSHHDLRMTITVEGDVDTAAIETMGRACSFVSGIDVEILRVERYSAVGALKNVRHLRGFRRLGRAPHSPFKAIADEHRMRAWTALVQAFPVLLKEGVPIDMIVDQISAQNQVSQIHLGAPLLLLPTLTAAYYRMHGSTVDEGAASRRQELALLNRELGLGISETDMDRFEKLRVEILDTGFFHAPGYETGRPQKDIKFLRDVAHVVVFRLCGYTGPYYCTEKFEVVNLD